MGAVAAATRISRQAISAGPVVAIVAIVALAAVILVLVVSYVFHHRAMHAPGNSASHGTAQLATEFGSNPPFSSEPGKDEFSR